jgi:hypothetical protein
MVVTGNASSFDSLDKVFSEENFFRNRPIRKKELPVVAMIVNESGRNDQSL